MKAGKRLIPGLAGLAFLVVAGTFAAKGSYLVAAVFVAGAVMFLRQLFRPADS